ncbi:hypothetical protein PTKIN_Ptkin14bG0083400 [Pterospermum kingtungense]
MRRVQSFRAIKEEEFAEFIRQISSKAGSPSPRCFHITRPRELVQALDGFSLSDVFPSLKFLHVITGATSKIKKLQGKFDKISRDMLDDHRARKETNQRSWGPWQDRSRHFRGPGRKIKMRPPKIHTISKQSI